MTRSIVHRPRARGALAAVALLVASTPANATGVAAPAKFSWRLDGAETQAHEYATPEPPDDALARLRTAWLVENPDSPAVVSRVGEAHVLGQRTGRLFRVAHLTRRADGATRVVLSTRALVASLSPADDLPLGAGSKVIRRVEMAHGAQAVVQVYALAPEPPLLAELRFEAAARRAGWDPTPLRHRRSATVVRAWRRGRDDLLVVTTPIAAGTGFLLHLAPRAAASERP